MVIDSQIPLCDTCGFELGKNAKFCPECGAPSASNDIATPEQSSSDAGRTQRRVGEPPYGVLNLENLPVGHVIDDRYEIKEKLGQGGFGAVYRAYDKIMDVDKALKVLPGAVANDQEAMMDLQSEAKAMVMLNHPNIVRVYDLHGSGAIKYIDMEFIQGQTVTEIKLEYPDKRIPEERVLELALQISEGLAYAHEQGVIHKDIKPQNIMVETSGNVKIMDFGIAEQLHQSMSRISNYSSSGTLVYMSPEQLRGKAIGRETDVYSLGAVLYELLSGHPPFYRGDIQHQIQYEPPAEIPTSTKWLNRVLQKCLAKDVTGRYSSLGDLKVALERQKSRTSGYPHFILVEDEKNEPKKSRREPDPVDNRDFTGQGQDEPNSFTEFKEEQFTTSNSDLSSSSENTRERHNVDPVSGASTFHKSRSLKDSLKGSSLELPPVVWLTIAAAAAAFFGWQMVHTASTWSFVWWLGGILLIGGIVGLLPAAATSLLIAIGLFIAYFIFRIIAIQF